MFPFHMHGIKSGIDEKINGWYIIFIFFSLSMKGEKFSIAKGVAKTVINTLTKQDYVNVVCARASHWDQVGK